MMYVIFQQNSNIAVYYISQVLPALELVRLAGRIVLYGTPISRAVFYALRARAINPREKSHSVIFSTVRELGCKKFVDCN